MLWYFHTPCPVRINFSQCSEFAATALCEIAVRYLDGKQFAEAVSGFTDLSDDEEREGGREGGRREREREREKNKSNKEDKKIE